MISRAGIRFSHSLAATKSSRACIYDAARHGSGGMNAARPRQLSQPTFHSVTDFAPLLWTWYGACLPSALKLDDGPQTATSAIGNRCCAVAHEIGA